jgi:hypothetical protein
MPQQTKLLMYAQERYDLPDKVTSQDLIETDFQLMNRGLITNNYPFIVKGFTVNHVTPPSLNISINPVGSVLVDGGNDGSMYYGPAGTALLTDVAVDGTTTYFWLETTTLDGVPATRTFWDPAALDGAGAEFNQIVNTERELIVTLNKNTIGFPVAGTTIPICRTTAVGGNITNFVDCRPMLFRLGQGGATPDLDYVYPWASGRTEPGTSGATTAIFNGGDKQFTCWKDCIAALQSVIKEMKWGTGTGVGCTWFAPTPSTLASMDITMTGGGVWTWNLGLTQLSFTADATVLIPGTAFVNTIQFAVSSPITLANPGDVAYVNINRTASVNITVTVVASSAYVPAIDRFIIARRVGNTAYIGIE